MFQLVIKWFYTMANAIISHVWKVESQLVPAWKAIAVCMESSLVKEHFISLSFSK